MGFNFKTAFAHLDGKAFRFRDLWNEMVRIRRENLGDYPAEIMTDHMWGSLMAMGWLTFPDDGTSGDDETVFFKICEDVREIRKRIDQYKADFIKEQAKIFLNEEAEDGQFYPVDVNVDEYRTAVRELANS
jgi:hypothetical protein